MAKGFLSSHGIPFTDKNVAVDPAAREELVARTGRTAVPVITVDDEVIVGFDRGRLHRHSARQATNPRRVNSIPQRGFEPTNWIGPPGSHLRPGSCPYGSVCSRLPPPRLPDEGVPSPGHFIGQPNRAQPSYAWLSLGSAGSSTIARWLPSARLFSEAHARNYAHTARRREQLHQLLSIRIALSRSGNRRLTWRSDRRIEKTQTLPG